MNFKKNVIAVASLTALVLVTYFGPSVVDQRSSAVAKDAKTDKVDLTSDKARLGYTYGAQMATELVRSGLVEEVELEAIFAAFRDMTDGKEPRLSVEEMQAVQTKFQDKQREAYEAVANENKAKGETFMAENAKADGVKTTDSGLQYEVLRAGKGKQPTAENTVKVHYSGKLIDGTEFDSSYKRDEPTDFPVSGVIPGFSEGLQLMKEGAKYRFTIPADKAYGPQGPGSIGPNQALIFEVELIEVL